MTGPLEPLNLEEIEKIRSTVEALAEQLERMRLYKAAAYVSMGADAIREVRNKLSGSS